MNTRVGSGTLHRLVVDDDGQEGMIDLEAAVVFDESEFLELVHEEIHRERVVTIHFCQRLPSDPRQDGGFGWVVKNFDSTRPPCTPSPPQPLMCNLRIRGAPQRRCSVAIRRMRARRSASMPGLPGRRPRSTAPTSPQPFTMPAGDRGRLHQHPRVLPPRPPHRTHTQNRRSEGRTRLSERPRTAS